jgi:hypothetical protein
MDNYNTNRCFLCNKEITAEESIKRGIGHDCYHYTATQLDKYLAKMKNPLNIKEIKMILNKYLDTIEKIVNFEVKLKNRTTIKLMQKMQEYVLKIKEEFVNIPNDGDLERYYLFIAIACENLYKNLPLSIKRRNRFLLDKLIKEIRNIIG